MKNIKTLLSLALLILIASCDEKPKPASTEKVIRTDSAAMIQPSQAAINSYYNIDVSPMDMIYFPVDYPKIKMANGNVAPPLARVIYSRPHLMKRHLFKDILKYDEPWRLGANEATEIDFYKTAKIQDKKIAPGRYILYCIPHTDSWTIVLNSNIDSWGLQQDAKKDIQRFTIPVKTDNPTQEYFTMQFEKTETGAILSMAWDNFSAKLPMEF